MGSFKWRHAGGLLVLALLAGCCPTSSIPPLEVISEKEVSPVKQACSQPSNDAVEQVYQTTEESRERSR